MMSPICLRVFVLLTLVAMSHERRIDFACSSDEFECTKSQTCTRLSWKCDGEHDCFDGEDEVGCEPVTCKSGYFKCSNGKCIEQSWVCDRHPDCPDQDDEAPTQNCTQTTCPPNSFQCQNGECIQASYRCDREHDCGDQSDEEDCPALVCESTEFKCSNNMTCVAGNLKCNGVFDCIDRSDEEGCPPTCDPTSQFACTNGECHPTAFRCDGDRDCTDGLDEVGCPTSPPLKATCASNQFQCGDGECIPLTWKCDNDEDCMDHSDEQGCPSTCASTKFTCVRSGNCISQHSRCDGVGDCADGSDEAGCAPLKCDDAFRCGSSSFCINNTKVCNGIRECPRGEDEAPNCGINECSDHNGHCIDQCNDLPIGYECSCNQGYKLANDSRSCEDLNECEEVYGSCSQKCLNEKGSFKCSCVDDYNMETGATATCRATGPQGYIVFGSEHSIHNITISGDHYATIVSNRKSPIAVAHDLQSGHVYWTDILEGKIQRSRLLGNGTVETVVDKVEHSNGLVIDFVGRKIYWTDETLKTIEVSELDGRNRMVLFTVNVDVPRGIALDPFIRYMFWTDWSGVHPKIERASMDGDALSRRIILDKDLTWPTALTADTIIQRLYFVDTKSQRIETIKYDGSGRKTLVSKGLVHPLGLAVFEDRLYYTDYSLNKISIVDRRTGRRIKELKGNLKRPTGINTVHPLKQKQVATQCSQNNGGCSHLCLLSSTSSRNFSCRCPNGMLLRRDGKTCSHTIEPNSTTARPPVGTTKKPPAGTTNKPTTEGAGQGKTKPRTTVSPTSPNKDGPLAKKQEGSSSSNYGPMAAGITVAVLVVVFLVVAAILYWRRRSKMADRSILFYKDSSRTPLQNDFDDDPIKDSDELAGMSRVEFT